MRTSRYTRVVMFGLAFALAMVPVGAASAGGGPVRVRAPFVPFTISGICPFDVYWEALADKGYYKIFTDPTETRYLLTGVLKSRFTNLQTGKSVDLNNSSQYTQVFYADGSATFTSSGPAIWFGFAGPGLPPLAYVRGHVEVKLDAAGNLVSTVVTGNVQDLCQTLGG